MIRNAARSLTVLGVVFGIIGPAHAGTIVYDWVTPSAGTNGNYFTGSITVDSSGISATPIDLNPLSGMIKDFQISVFNSSNDLLFNLTPTPANFITLALTINTTQGSNQFTAPQITLSAIYLPSLSLIAGTSSDESLVKIYDQMSASRVVWENLITSSSFSGSVTANGPIGSTIVNDQWSTNGETLVATAESTPEPASLTIWSLAVIGVGAGLIRKRRRSSAVEV